MKRVLVTGGAGFIGHHLCKKLVESDHIVTSIDNYFTGSKENHVDGVTYHDMDVKYINDINESFDIVYHLGEYSRVEQSFDDFDLVWNYNKINLEKVLQFVKNKNCKLIYAGSSTKFANAYNGYIVSPYQWSKESNTELVKLFCQWNNIDYAITYFYNVYGEKEISEGKYATLIALFKEKMRKKEKLTIVSPGTQLRNFTHVDDIVDGLYLIGEKGHGDEYGIGHSKSYSILQIAEMFEGEIEMMPARKGNRMSSEVITDKTISLGWKPHNNLEDYIDDFKKDLKKVVYLEEYFDDVKNQL